MKLTLLVISLESRLFPGDGTIASSACPDGFNLNGFNLNPQAEEASPAYRRSAATSLLDYSNRLAILDAVTIMRYHKKRHPSGRRN
jgi:hypothetical protein